MFPYKYRVTKNFFLLDQLFVKFDNDPMQNDLLRVSTLLLKNLFADEFISLFVDHARDVSFSDLACLYLYNDRGGKNDDEARLVCRRGEYRVAGLLPPKSGLAAFLRESREALVLSSPEDDYFPDVLLCPGMQSGMALWLGRDLLQFGVFILNSHSPGHYTRERFEFLTAFTTLAGIMYSHRLNAGEFKNRGKNHE
jgi:hypothetical protein